MTATQSTWVCGGINGPGRMNAAPGSIRHDVSSTQHTLESMHGMISWAKIDGAVKIFKLKSEQQRLGIFVPLSRNSAWV